MLHKVSRARVLAGDRDGAARASREAARIAVDSDDAALRRACGLIDDQRGPAQAGPYDRDRGFTQEEL
jgi:hypothetical protein